MISNSQEQFEKTPTDFAKESRSIKERMERDGVVAGTLVEILLFDNAEIHEFFSSKHPSLRCSSSRIFKPETRFAGYVCEENNAYGKEKESIWISMDNDPKSNMQIKICYAAIQDYTVLLRKQR